MLRAIIRNLSESVVWTDHGGVVDRDAGGGCQVNPGLRPRRIASRRWLRLRRNESQAQLAKEAGISKRTLERMEAGQSVQLTSLIRVLRALDVLNRLEAALPEPQPSPRELVALRGRERRRASPSSTGDDPSRTEWTWSTEE